MSVFKDIREFVAIPRLLSLRLSPDGSRLVTVVQSLNPDGKSYGTSIWAVPVEPGGEAYRLTRSAKGEAGARFTPDGDLLFVSGRPDPTAKEQPQDEPAALWLLPAQGGEARRVADRPGGVGSVETGGRTVVFTSDVLPGDAGTEAERRKARKDAGVSAVLHEGYPIRYWDHDLGPGRTRLFAAGLPSLAEPRDLTPDPGGALLELAYAVTPDGSTVVTTWAVPLPGGGTRYELAAIDVATGERRVVASSAEHDFQGPLAISPDGRHVACDRAGRATQDRAVEHRLWIAPLDGGEGAQGHSADLMPSYLAWAPDSRSLYAAADHLGRRPIYRVGLTGEYERLTPDDSAYAELCPSPDGHHLYALRSAPDAPPAPVRLDLRGGEVEALASPAPAVTIPGRLTEVSAVADDGVEIRGWLVLPDGASADNPAPLLLWVHGGPVASWNDWMWRWNPWIMAEHGYAVLLPDPCLSTGYGQEMIQRGWSAWGPRTHADLMAVTDACVARPDIDAGRTAMMGGSFGGYMANWIAGHTDRFRAIVTHASLWNLEQFAGTTDGADYWEREFGPVGAERYRELSPHLWLDKITTPMLVIHGDKDYRVPIGEALRLWWDLRRTSVESKFLYFPDENHWILKPGNAVAWYETVLAFLAQHVLGEEWQRPESLA
ncbi:peptidase S9 [Sphaerisporangium melleum]|uniref:Peptidase S9 n=1 Tax=Sphaerisporangium melleum TaxID=321316 RepID=A0A917VG00_9ACTN|nr:S9 family peptidase [Sphaerisporangium melleum]GGK72848.1 peptidase S9 [Sphaerisporangium melleum]GII68282.1 peptidase S9 [Sphaerisporangium melleum]